MTRRDDSKTYLLLPVHNLLYQPVSGYCTTDVVDAIVNDMKLIFWESTICQIIPPDRLIDI